MARIFRFPKASLISITTIAVTIVLSAVPLVNAAASSRPSTNEYSQVNDFANQAAGLQHFRSPEGESETKDIKSPGKYQVDILPLKTSRGVPSPSLEESKVIISKASRIFEDLSQGRVSLEFRSFIEMIEVEDTFDDPSTLERLLKVRPAPDSGFQDVLLIGLLTPGPGYFAGIAVRGGNSIVLNTSWSSSNRTLLTTLVHEIGHNLGLDHSGSAQCALVSSRTECDVTEYGDHSDFMGRFMPAYVTEPTILRLSAINLHKMGWLPESAILQTTKSGTYELSPVYSKEGTRLIVIPAYNEAAYAIEYRPAIGPDALLSQTKLQIPNSLSFYTNIPSHGVQVRMLRGQKDKTQTLLPVLSKSIMSLLTPNSTEQGFAAGQRLTLPDGTTLKVLSTDPAKGAQIELVFEPDTTPPTLGAPRVSWGGLFSDEVTIRNNQWREITLDTFAITDNRVIDYLKVEVNGQEVVRVTYPFASSTLSYKPTTIGTFEVKITAVDSAKNESSHTGKLVSKKYQHNTSRVFFKPGNKKNALLELWVPKRDWMTYTISNLSAGSLGSVRETIGWYVTSISGLKPGQSIAVDVVGVDKYGQTDGGQRVEGKASKGRR